MDFFEIKNQVFTAMMNLYKADLIRLSAGNISARINTDLAAITPRSRSYDIMKPEDICIISLDGKLVEGEFKPSSETPLHTAIYREMPQVGAVVHTHSIYAMTFSASEKKIPLLGVEALAAHSNGPIPVARYVSPGSSQAGEVAMEVFRANPGLQALLLRNHGLLTIGPDVETAWQTAYKVETAAQVAYQAFQLGKIVELTSEQVKEIFEIYSVKK
jgi:L-ribulose-5-phosphate 4-epimerase